MHPEYPIHHYLCYPAPRLLQSFPHFGKAEGGTKYVFASQEKPQRSSLSDGLCFLLLCWGVQQSSASWGPPGFGFCFSIVFSEGRGMWDCCLLALSILPEHKTSQLCCRISSSSRTPLSRGKSFPPGFKGFELGPAVH